MVTTLDVVKRIGRILQDPAVELGLEAALSTEATLWIDDVPACIFVVLVGPPGGAKSTTIKVIRGNRGYQHYTDLISPHAFVSHYAGKSSSQLQDDVDLLPRIRGKTLIISDLTPLLSAPENELREFLGTLTRVLDGEGLWSDKGVHGQRGYGGPGEDYRFVMVAGSTPLGRMTWKVLGNLGPRLLTINLQQPHEPPDPPDAGYRARVSKAAVVVDGFMRELWDRHGYRGVTWESPLDQAEQELWNLSSLVVRWRAPLPETGDLPVFERPFRLFDSLRGLVRGHALLDDRMDLEDTDYQLVRRLALDSMPEARRRLLRALLAVGSITAAEAANCLRMTEQGAIKHHLAPLEESLGLLVKGGAGTRGSPYVWQLADQERVSPWEKLWAAAVTP